MFCCIINIGGYIRTVNKFLKLQTVEDTIEARALAEASPMDSVRFLLETDTWTDDPEQKSNDNSSNLASAGEKVDQELD